MASAFGGLLAYGVFQIKGGALHVWAYLFILEGCLTCLIAIAAYFILPGDIGDAYFLTAVEKEVAMARMRTDTTQALAPKFVWSEALSEFRTIHAYARVLISVACGLLPQSSANFLAIMTVRLGYSVTKTNLVSGLVREPLLRVFADYDFSSTVYGRSRYNGHGVCSGICLFIRLFPRAWLPYGSAMCYRHDWVHHPHSSTRRNPQRDRLPRHILLYYRCKLSPTKHFPC